MNKKRKMKKISLSLTAGLSVVAIGGLIGIMSYYQIDPKLLASLSFYEEMAHRKNISFDYDIEHGLVLCSDEYILSIIVHC